MSQFKYRGRSGRGETITGRLDAESVDGAASRLLNLGITPLDITQKQFRKRLRGYEPEEVEAFDVELVEDDERRVPRSLAREEFLRADRRHRRRLGGGGGDPQQHPESEQCLDAGHRILLAGPGLHHPRPGARCKARAAHQRCGTRRSRPTS